MAARWVFGATATAATALLMVNQVRSRTVPRAPDPVGSVAAISAPTPPVPADAVQASDDTAPPSDGVVAEPPEPGAADTPSRPEVPEPKPADAGAASSDGSSPAPQRLEDRDTVSVTVTPGTTLFGVLRSVYGPAHRIDNWEALRAEILHLNPHVKDVNVIIAGDLLHLPRDPERVP